MSNYALILIIFAYLALLFYIVHWGNKQSRSRWVNNPYVYTLSLAVYCTAWTYYGSVGTAAESGIMFLPIYLGPIIAIPLWIVVMRKIIRIAKHNKIASIADFISLRYGRDKLLGAIVTLVCIVGTVPYISLQLKAISETFKVMTVDSQFDSKNILHDSTFYIALILAVFVTFFSTQKTDASIKNRGIIVSVAFEAILKLAFFLAIGIYVTFYMFDGTTDIYNQISQTENFEKLIGFDGIEQGLDWFFLVLLSFFAIFLLPRQFHVAVVENDREKHLKKAIWLFPLYLLLFNVFVIFIAWGGKLTFGDTVNSDYYTLLLPLQNGNTLIALLVFLGGFSAVISMVVISTIALSNMVSNNLVIPYGFLDKFVSGNSEGNESYIKLIRRVAIFSIIILAYIFYANFSVQMSLYSIGLISFVIIALLAPSFFIGLYWNRGAARGTIAGIISGFIIILYTLIIPFIIEAYGTTDYFIQNGLFGIEALRPHALFGIDFLSPASHAFFWSLIVNTIVYLWVSISSKGNYRERNYAEIFVDPKVTSSLDDNAYVWKGEAYVIDIKNVLIKFLGVERTERALSLFFRKYDIAPDAQLADARLINFSEKLLTGTIGGASAKILISSVVKEDEVSLVEVLKILEESKETIASNKLLKDKSRQLTELTSQLKDVNSELIEKDKQKDEFLDTVAHELKTPLTGIRGAAELLLDDADEMTPEIRDQFLRNILQDSDRFARLIHNILDFEKLSEDREELMLKKYNFRETLKHVVLSLSQVAIAANVRIKVTTQRDVFIEYDEDRIIQVLTNLLSNGIKFANKEDGIVWVQYKVSKKVLNVSVSDNGLGVPNEDIDFVFDKFYQSKNQNTIKPEGSGLGLAISQRIIERHNGTIEVVNDEGGGANFKFEIPVNQQ
ncbi:sensor histidine kinase [Crocinitomix catalasitica]|uniref:sensor histidine kinase n=1 Tax=Crocinitomix catalasitica TaxID=184607 RepID=UPI0004832098|nr:sensor histidine kinase [Crocinitomix catalasitica]